MSCCEYCRYKYQDLRSHTVCQKYVPVKNIDIANTNQWKCMPIKWSGFNIILWHCLMLATLERFSKYSAYYRWQDKNWRKNTSQHFIRWKFVSEVKLIPWIDQGLKLYVNSMQQGLTGKVSVTVTRLQLQGYNKVIENILI